jgi:general secretion pathway protein M
MMATHAPAGTREALAHWWHMRSTSERRWLRAIVAVVVVALLWLVVWLPLVRDTDRLVQHLPLDKAALAEARRASDEIAGLSRSAPAPQASDARAALDAVLAAKNVKSAATQIERIDNDRLRATFERIDFDTLAATLDALQREAHLRAIEVVATARVEPGLVRADVTLTR